MKLYLPFYCTTYNPLILLSSEKFWTEKGPGWGTRNQKAYDRSLIKSDYDVNRGFVRNTTAMPLQIRDKRDTKAFLKEAQKTSRRRNDLSWKSFDEFKKD